MLEIEIGKVLACDHIALDKKIPAILTWRGHRRGVGRERFDDIAQ
jgi:hypothetical protein